MIQRIAILFLEIVLAVVVVTLIAAAAIAWRLSDGPIEVAWARGYIEAALSDEATGYTTRVGDTTLAWSGWDRAFDVNADNVALIDPQGAVRARIGSISVALSPRALLAGRLAPERIDILNPAVTALRRADGTWRLLPEIGGGDPGTPLELSALLRAVTSGTVGLAPFSYLRAVEIRGATIRLADDARARTLTLTGVVAALNLTKEGVDFRLRGEVAWPAFAPSPVTLSGSYDTARDRIDAALDFAALPPPALVEFDPALARLRNVELPVSGRVTLAARPDGRPLSTQAELTLGAGRVRIPEVNGDWLRIDGGSVALDYDGEAGRVSADVSLDLEGVPVAARVRAQRERAGYAVIVDAGLSDLPVDSIRRYWPPALAVGARGWVTGNLDSGRVTGATLRLEGWIDPAAPETRKLDTLAGRIDFTGVNTHYFRPLPPVRGSSGTATFEDRRMDIAISGGRLNAIEVETASVALENLGIPRREVADIDVAIRGPLPEMLTLLDRQPLGYPGAIGLEVARTEGWFAARLRFEIPLLKALKLGDVGVAVSADLEAATIPLGFGEKVLRDGDLTVELTGSGMTLEGSGTVAGAVAEVAHEESFQAGDAIKSRSTLKATVAAAELAAFGLDAGDALTGPVDIQAVIVSRFDGRAVSEITADLQQAVLRLDAAGWEKPAGSVGVLRAVIEQAADGGLTVPEVDIRAADLVAAGSLAFAGEGGVVADLSTFRLGSTDAAGRIEQRADGALLLAMQGPVIDLSGVLESDASEGGSTRLEARFAAERLILYDGIALDDGILSARLTGARVEQVGLTGGLDGTPLRLAVQPVEGKRRLTLQSRDAGRVLDAFGITRSIRGGRLQVEGELLGDGLQDALALSARLDAFRVTDAPAFARLLSVASLTGFFDALSGDGLRFARATGDVTLSADSLEIRNGLAYGPGLGLKLDGAVGRGERESVDMRGLLAPAYSLSRLIDVVPVLGELITGGEGESMLATSFAIQGTNEDPVITVNPLSALAPGFVRDLLSAAGRPPGDAPPGAPPPPGREEDREP